MSRLIAALQTTVLLAGLFILTVPADLACCTGVAEIHGPSCCDSADTNAMAASCCAGDQVPLARHAEPQAPPPILQAVNLLPVAVQHPVAGLPLRGRTTYPPPPGDELFRLHSAFLI